MSRLTLGVRNALLSKHKLFGRREYKLAKSRLLEDEYIKDTVYGSYQGGKGLLVVTNKRVMVVDKRPFFDYVEEAPHNLIDHLDYVSAPIGSTLTIRLNKTFFRFRSYNEAKMRNTYGVLQFELAKDTSSPYELSQVDTALEPSQKVIKPLRRRARRHPAWSPHNPIMTGVISTSGVQLSDD